MKCLLTTLNEQKQCLQAGRSIASKLSPEAGESGRTRRHGMENDGRTEGRMRSSNGYIER